MAKAKFVCDECRGDKRTMKSIYTAPPSSGSPIWPIIIVVLLLLIFAGSLFYYLRYSKTDTSKEIKKSMSSLKARQKSSKTKSKKSLRKGSVKKTAWTKIVQHLSEHIPTWKKNSFQIFNIFFCVLSLYKKNYFFPVKGSKGEGREGELWYCKLTLKKMSQNFSFRFAKAYWKRLKSYLDDGFSLGACSPVCTRKCRAWMQGRLSPQMRLDGWVK